MQPRPMSSKPPKLVAPLSGEALHLGERKLDALRIPVPETTHPLESAVTSSCEHPWETNGTLTPISGLRLAALLIEGKGRVSAADMPRKLRTWVSDIAGGAMGVASSGGGENVLPTSSASTSASTADLLVGLEGTPFGDPAADLELTKLVERTKPL